MRKGQLELRFFVALIIIVIGVLAVSFIGFGLLLNNSAIVWVGSIVLTLVSLISAFAERLLLE